MDPRLVAISGPLRGQEYRLDGGRITIGRDPANRVAPLDAAVSRQHCVVEWLDDAAQLIDLESHNGTFVNGIPVSRRALVHGDVVRVGRCELVYLTEDVPSSSAQRVYSLRTAGPGILKTIKLQDSASWMADPTDIGRMARDLNALVKISRTINSIREVGELQRNLLECVFEVVPAGLGAILLMDQADVDPESTRTLSRESGRRDDVEIPHQLVQRAIWEQSAVVAQGGDDPAAQHAICIPLLGVTRTIGVLYLSSGQPGEGFGDDHVHFLNSVCSIAAVTLENLLALESLKAENRRLREELHPAEDLVGDSKSMRHLTELIAKVARGDSTVLIRGESGTGKELVARAIHAAGPRADKPFVAINCAAIPDTLLESELFGHEKGSFTGAVAMKKGRLEVAEDGTILLDEIGEMPLMMQAKLLRVLQQREFERIGSTRPLKLHARVLAATNKELDAAIKAGEFRQDLYFRLNVVSIPVPPLRNRREDIPLLAIYFANKYAPKRGRPFRGISPEARAMLLNYDWPGNVRELENAIEHAIVLGASDEICPEDLPEALHETRAAATQTNGAKYHAALTELKKRLIRDALAEARGSYTDAAKILGVHPNYLHRLIRNLEMKAELREQEEE